MFLFYCEQERVLQVCTYSGSSSDTETEPEGTGSTLGPRTLINRAKKSDSGLAEHFITKSFWYLSFCPLSPPPPYFLFNKFLRPQSTRMRRPWREAVWRNLCQSWTTTNTMCSHIWRRTAGGFPSTTCCTRSHPLMAKQETDSVWVLKQLIVHSWLVLLIKDALQACCWFLSRILSVITHSYNIQEAAQAVIFNTLHT